MLFDDLVAKIQDRIAEWENKVLSPGGRITLLRSVFSSLPIYLLQVFKPPTCVIERIDRLFNSFLWEGSTGTRKIHWASWHKITLPSNEGGLDIRGLGDVMQAFSMKLWWRFLTCNSIWTHFIWSKYCASQIPRNVKSKLWDSQTWKWMLASCSVIEQFTRCRIGKGELFFWHDCWMGEAPLVSRYPSFASSTTRVCYFYDNGKWDLGKLNNVLPEEVVAKILKISIDPLSVDTAFWVPTSNGQFTIKSV
ncbi:Uncharacterized protein TCM_040145 [Theobroma cacao]|uniref:Reverse transcriptase zinc-binding domain-containing protein n=1 Tax=Theobroma cacao TaxID=3641 RepID=A0A061GR67_THECC|nr:Uncharacterized protein TCM_040145 [Theobroma cacao]